MSGAFVLALLLLTATGPGLPAATRDNPYLTGRLLVATPQMEDPRFAQTVIYMVRHSDEGAMGLVINRPVAQGPIADILRELGLEHEGASGTITLHYGGPVEQGKGFVLHSDEYVRDGTIRVQGGFALTTDVEILRAISHGRGPRRSLLALGYAGWGPGQIEAEINSQAWFSIPAEEALIFDSDAETKWERARDRRKIEL